MQHVCTELASHSCGLDRWEGAPHVLAAFFSLAFMCHMLFWGHVLAAGYHKWRGVRYKIARMTCALVADARMRAGTGLATRCRCRCEVCTKSRAALSHNIGCAPNWRARDLEVKGKGSMRAFYMSVGHQTVEALTLSDD
eukprot:scaffold33565_cov22-Tisochrysis_lutea.AAC.2